MIPDPNCIPRLVEDYQFASFLRVLPLLVLDVVLRPTVTVKCNSRPLFKPIYNSEEIDRIKRRVANLEARQTLTEAELALLRGQLNYESVRK